MSNQTSAQHVPVISRPVRPSSSDQSMRTTAAITPGVAQFFAHKPTHETLLATGAPIVATPNARELLTPTRELRATSPTAVPELSAAPAQSAIPALSDQGTADGTHAPTSPSAARAAARVSLFSFGRFTRFTSHAFLSRLRLSTRAE